MTRTNDVPERERVVVRRRRRRKDTPGGWVTVAPGVQFVPTTGRYRARASAPGGKRVSAGAATREAGSRSAALNSPEQTEIHPANYFELHVWSPSAVFRTTGMRRALTTEPHRRAMKRCGRVGETVFR